MSNQTEIISEFLDKKTISALGDFLEKDSDFEKSADLIAKAFGADKGLSKTDAEGIKKLVSSFKNNLTLLVQKTWVEKSDVALKEQLIYKLNSYLEKNNWKADYPTFLEIINQAVLLMFGQDPSSDDFSEYTLRIDPEFGIFWWYISSLPDKAKWSEDKYRLAMMIGMYFLANY